MFDGQVDVARLCRGAPIVKHTTPRLADSTGFGLGHA